MNFSAWDQKQTFSYFEDPIQIDCSTKYNNLIEISMYVASCSYLIPGIMLHLLILKTILLTHRKSFAHNSFFRIFTTDSVTSVLLLLWDVLFIRLGIFVPPICPILSPLFSEPSLFLKVFYWTYNQARMTKSVAQIMMVANRMCCVWSPVAYDKYWNKYSAVTVLLILVLPFAGTWNLLLSRMLLFPYRGGFNTTYFKYVEWASLSMFQSIFILTALLFTIVCTSASLYKLCILPDRIKKAEKSLCLASIFYSIAFLIVAASQLMFAFCTKCLEIGFLVLFQFLAFDILTVGSSVIVLLTSSQLSSRITVFRKLRKSESATNDPAKIFTAVHVSVSF